MIVALANAEATLRTLFRVDDMSLVGRVGDGLGRTGARALGATYAVIGDFEFHHLLA